MSVRAKCITEWREEDMQFRQGDVLIRRVRRVPAKAKLLERADGRIVLAEGELTGHAHAVLDPGAALLETDDARFLRVLETAGLLHAHKCRGLDGSTVYVPFEQDPASYSPPLQKVGEEWVHGVTITHEEHRPFIAPVGDYGVERQREYAPEEIRQVSD